MANEHAFELEGNADFDYLYGLSALQVGQFEPAIFSFERLSASFPNIQRYRLELARSYFYLGNLEQADKEFDRVLATHPPANVQQNIQVFKDRIAAQRKAMQNRWQASVSVAAGYDSNYNSATSAEQIEILNGLLVAKLGKQQRHQESPFMQLRAIGNYTQPINRRTSWDMSAAASQRLITENSDYNLSLMSAQTGLRRLYGKWQLRPTVGINQYWLGGDSFQQDINAGGEVYWHVTPMLQPFVRLNITASNNKVNNDADRIRPSLETGIGLAKGAVSGQASLSYASDFAQHHSKVFMRDTLGLNLAGQYRFNQGDVYANVLLQSNDYQDNMAVFATRDETFSQLLVGYRHLLPKQFTAYAQLSHLNNSSNVDLYQYRRTVIETGLTLVF